MDQRLQPFLTKWNQQDLQVLKELIEAATVTPVIDRTYTLGEAPEAALRPRPVADDQQHAPPAPQRRLQPLPDLSPLSPVGPWARRSRGQPQQDELIKTLPVFQREPPKGAATPAAKGQETAKPSSSVLIGRLFASF